MFKCATALLLSNIIAHNLVYAAVVVIVGDV